jgi:hypothetical protein
VVGDEAREHAAEDARHAEQHAPVGVHEAVVVAGGLARRAGTTSSRAWRKKPEQNSMATMIRPRAASMRLHHLARRQRGSVWPERRVAGVEVREARLEGVSRMIVKATKKNAASTAPAPRTRA